MKNWSPILYSILGVCFAVAFWLSLTTSIQLNESYSLWLATKSVPLILQTEAQNFTLPLYSILLHFWVQIVGTDIIMMRLMSLLFFAFTVYFLYRLSFEANGEEDVALATVVLFALSPFILWYTTEAQTYALFTLVVSANHLYFLRMLRSGARLGKLGFLLSTLAGLFTHYLFIFLILSQLVYIGVRLVFGLLKQKKMLIFILAYSLLTALAGSVFAFWTYYLHGLGLVLPQRFYITPTSLPYAGQLFMNFFFGFPTVNFQSILVALWPVSVIFLFLILTHDASMKLKNALYFIMVTFLPIILTFFVSFLQPFFVPRSLIFTVPSLFIITGWLLMNFSKKVFSLTLLFVLLAIGLLLFEQINSQAVPVKENYKTVDAYVNKYITPYDIVIVASPFAVYPVEYYYTGPARISTIPEWNQYTSAIIPSYSEEHMERQIGSYKGVYGRAFVILSYDQGYNSKISYYLDHHYKRLAFQVFPPNIELRVYQLSYNFPVPPLP